MDSCHIPRVSNSGIFSFSLSPSRFVCLFFSLNSMIFGTAFLHVAFADRQYRDLICPLCHLNSKSWESRAGVCASSCAWMTLFPAALVSDTVGHVPAAVISAIKLQGSHTNLFLLFVNMPLVLISIAEAKSLPEDAVEILSKPCLTYS